MSLMILMNAMLAWCQWNGFNAGIRTLTSMLSTWHAAIDTTWPFPSDMLSMIAYETKYCQHAFTEQNNDDLKQWLQTSPSGRHIHNADNDTHGKHGVHDSNACMTVMMRAWLLWNDSLAISSFRSSLQWFSFSAKDMRSCNHMELWQWMMRTRTHNKLTRFRDRSILIISLAPVYMVPFQWFRFILASFIIKMITLFTILTHSINMK